MSSNSAWNAEYNKTKGSLLVGNGTRPIVRIVGADGEVLTADSAQVDGLLWAAPSGAFSSIVIQVFTASGTYTPTLGMQQCIVECIGGGGGGGGARATGLATRSVGGGGGAAGYSRGVFSAATIGAGVAFSIGVFGTGGAGAASGSTGSVTTFGGLLSATAGNGGNASLAAASAAANGGTAGVGGGAGASLILSGGRGMTGFVNASFGISGEGGKSFFGNGGLEVLVTSQSGNAPTTFSYGSGGSGGINDASQSAVAGGNGSDGVVVITEFV